MASTKKEKKKIFVDSDSHSDESDSHDRQKADETTSSLRCSYRLESKRKRPNFKLPTREKIWKDIPLLKSPEKLNRITPRKSISNFTKVYNSYNFDDYEDTGDEESGLDSDSSSSSEAETRKRVKHYHKRIMVASSSSSSDENDCVPLPVPDSNIRNPQLHNRLNQDASDDKDDQKDKCDYTEINSTPTTVSEYSEDLKVPADISQTLSINDSNSGRNKEDSDLHWQDSSDDSEACIAMSQRLNSSQRSVLRSDDESDSENTASPDTTKTTNQRFQRSSNLKEQQKKLFSGLKDARAKRKSRSSNSEMT